MPTNTNNNTWTSTYTYIPVTQESPWSGGEYSIAIDESASNRFSADIDNWRADMNRSKSRNKPRSTVHAKVVAGVLQAMPQPLKQLMMEHGPKVVLAGGAIRAVAAGEPIRDFDIFVSSKEAARNLVQRLWSVSGSRNDFHMVDSFESRYAFNVRWEYYTVETGEYKPGTHIQFVFHHSFTSPQEIPPSFDFIMSKAAIWYDLESQKWVSFCDEEFANDVKEKMLTFTPSASTAGKLKSLKRALKFVKQGWTLPPKSLISILQSYDGSLTEQKLKELLESDYDD